jgi:hypothetical protein
MMAYELGSVSLISMALIVSAYLHQIFLMLIEALKVVSDSSVFRLGQHNRDEKQKLMIALVPHNLTQEGNCQGWRLCRHHNPLRRRSRRSYSLSRIQHCHREISAPFPERYWRHPWYLTRRRQCRRMGTRWRPSSPPRANSPASQQLSRNILASDLSSSFLGQNVRIMISARSL